MVEDELSPEFMYERQETFHGFVTAIGLFTAHMAVILALLWAVFV